MCFTTEPVFVYLLTFDRKNLGIFACIDRADRYAFYNFCFSLSSQRNLFDFPYLVNEGL